MYRSEKTSCKTVRLLKETIALLLTAACLSPYVISAQPAVQGAVTIHVDLKQELGAMKPIWAWFGHDEPNYTYMKDGKKLLSELSALSPVPVYMRVHNLLTSGDGTP